MTEIAGFPDGPRKREAENRNDRSASSWWDKEDRRRFRGLLPETAADKEDVCR